MSRLLVETGKTEARVTAGVARQRSLSNGSPAMVTSPWECNIFEWNVKLLRSSEFNIHFNYKVDTETPATNLQQTWQNAFSGKR